MGNMQRLDYINSQNWVYCHFISSVWIHCSEKHNQCCWTVSVFSAGHKAKALSQNKSDWLSSLKDILHLLCKSTREVFFWFPRGIHHFYILSGSVQLFLLSSSHNWTHHILLNLVPRRMVLRSCGWTCQSARTGLYYFFNVTFTVFVPFFFKPLSCY